MVLCWYDGIVLIKLELILYESIRVVVVVVGERVKVEKVLVGRFCMQIGR